MFAGIAARYDIANRLLSLGIDIYWRHILVQQVRACTPKTVTDLACGSGDVTFALKQALDNDVEVNGLDFCQPMLDEAERKKTKYPDFAYKVKFTQGDCLNLPLADNSMDALTIAFGLRNLENRPLGLAEMHRVLRPGGHLFMLEFTQPDAWFKPFYFVYLKWILPLIARVVTGNLDAYRYLVGSIETFPTRLNLQEEIKNAGFQSVSFTCLTFGIVAIHRGKK